MFSPVFSQHDIWILNFKISSKKKPPQLAVFTNSGGLFFFARLPSSDRLRLGIAKVKKEKEMRHFHEIGCLYKKPVLNSDKT